MNILKDKTVIMIRKCHVVKLRNILNVSLSFRHMHKRIFAMISHKGIS